MMSADDELWEQRFAELERYIRIFGHARIAPVGIHSKLRIWLLAQEHKAVAGMLPPARLARLAALGVEVFTREERWQIRFAQLREFREQFGHTRVAGKWKPHPQLGNWVHAQRGAQRRGQLQAERIRQLDTLGFEWIPPSPIVPIEQRWEEMFAHLVRYRRQHGDTEVPKHYAEVPDLAKWMRRQRRSGNRGQMPARHRARLEAIGFAWEHDGRWQRDRWEERFTQLLAFRERFGHTRVPAKWKENLPLGHWVGVQREWKKKDMLTAGRIARLEAIDFAWEVRPDLLPKEEHWKRMCAHLAEFMREHGHARVPKAFPPVPGLKQWVTRQRRLMRGGSLPEDRRAKLDAMGFPWGDPPVSPHDHWEQRFARLLEYRARFGHCRVPVHWKEDGAFGYWAYTQRAFKKEGSLSSERIARLEAIGFEWEIPSSRAFLYEEQWAATFSQLLDWQKEHGHTEVSSADSGGTLGTWVQTQRKHWRKGTLQPEHRRKLEAIGFAWRATRPEYVQRWEGRFQQLLVYRQRFGHCRVPAKWKEDVPLGHWVSVQREFRKTGLLSADRIARLEAIGFEWHGRSGRSLDDDQRWLEMFARLAACHREHGSTGVPQDCMEASLRAWVNLQRYHHRLGNLLPERREKLESIGFAWRPTRRGGGRHWEHRFQQLLVYRQRFGHCRVPAKWKEDVPLAHWVGVQRQYKRKGKLSPERIRQLEEIGFEWSLRSGRDKKTNP